MEKTINYNHKSTLYIPVKCTMQQSVNGNIEHKTCDNKERGTKSAQLSPLPSFCVCFSCTLCVRLRSSCCEEKKKKKKSSSTSIGLWQGGSFQCEFVAANCLSDRFFKGAEAPLAQGFSSEIVKQVIYFHAENTRSAVSWAEPDNSFLNSQLHLRSFPRIPKSSDNIAAQSLLSQK